MMTSRTLSARPASLSKNALLFLIVSAALAAAMFAQAGCSRNKFVIPLQADAKAQFDYAAKLERAYRSPLGKETRKENYERAIAGYRKVIESFPEDQKWPPRAELLIAMMQDTEGHDDTALQTYEKMIEKYPNENDIQVNALYGAAVIYDESKKFDKAQEYYLEITKRFAKTDNPAFKRIVRDAYGRSQRTRKK